MLRIAICDDSEIEREFLSDYLKEYCGLRAIPYQCIPFESGEALWYEVCDGEWYDIVVLDIYMEPSLGIDVARRLRDRAYPGTILFCTGTLDFAPQSFEVGAAGYLLKPYSWATFVRTMDRVTAAILDGTYPVKCRTRVIRVPYREILYVESRNSQCILHRTGGEIHTIYKKLGEIERELDAPCFLRCHRSYLVNMNYIRSVGADFTLSSGDTVLIRKRDLRAIRQAYHDYISGIASRSRRPPEPEKDADG